jgi:uncharacterized OB-fold protein
MRSSGLDALANSQQPIKRPIPVASALTQAYWDFAQQRRLAIQRCQSCGIYLHPPTPVCLHCHSTALRFEPVSGRGRIASFTILHDVRVDGLAGATPLVVLAVELDEQPDLIVVANLLDSNRRDVQIGTRVVVEFEQIAENFLLPQFVREEIDERRA